MRSPSRSDDRGHHLADGPRLWRGAFPVGEQQVPGRPIYRPAEVLDVDRDRLLADDDLPQACLQADELQLAHSFIARPRCRQPGVHYRGVLIYGPAAYARFGTIRGQINRTGSRRRRYQEAECPLWTPEGALRLFWSTVILLQDATALCLRGHFLPKLSNSPFRTPPRNACHSSGVNRRTAPSASLLLRTPISSSGRLATSTQFPLEKLSELLTQ